MALKYSDVLADAIDSLRAGADRETVGATQARHADRLGADLALVESVSRAGDGLPAPSEQTHELAASRLMANLQTARTAAAKPPVRARIWSPVALTQRLALPAMAIAVVAIVLVWLLAPNGQSTIEASTLEGVVIENEEGRLTVQTLGELEEVSVPEDAVVADAQGTAIGLDRIGVGTVVLVEVRREGNNVTARRIRQIQSDIESWCSGLPERCRALSTGLERAAERCRTETSSCRRVLGRIEPLRLRAALVGRIEDLKARCRDGEQLACRELAVLCLEHEAACMPRQVPEAPDSPRDGPSPSSEEVLPRVCQLDAVICRQELQPEPTTAPADQRPAAVATQRPLDVSPAATPVPRRDALPTSTPARRATPVPTERTR
jgi:hypothetical protein